MEKEKNEPSLEGKKAIIIQELVRGRKFANQLLQLVCHGSNKGDQESLITIRPFAEDLVRKIHGSFTNTLLLFNTNHHNLDHSDDVLFIDSSSVWNIREKSEDHDLDETYKSLSKRDERGCRKRKRTIQTWVKESPVLVDDGHSWRKYGQKMTSNAKYLRNYYRCSHKYDEGCPAMKQVQRIQDNPPLYRTTYFDLHICNYDNHFTNYLDDPSSPSDHSSILLSFDNAALQNQQAYHPFFSSSSPMKEHHQREHIVDVEQNQVSRHEHATVLSSTFDLFSSLKFESFEVDDDDVLLRCFDFDEFSRFGL